MKFLTRPWGKMAYADRVSDGDGEGASGGASGAVSGGGGVPLLLLPGTACYIEDWDAMIAALPAGTRTIALDFRGHGKSDVPAKGYTLEDLADDAVALIGHLALERCILVGHSLGGMVGALAAARSARIAALVLLEGWTGNDACDGAYGFDRTFGRLGADVVAVIQRKIDETVARHPREVWATLERSGGSFNSYNWLAGATIPIFEVYGDYGRNEQTLAKLRIPDNPRITTIWIPGGGHYLPHEKPRQCAEVCAQAMRAVQR